LPNFVTFLSHFLSHFCHIFCHIFISFFNHFFQLFVKFLSHFLAFFFKFSSHFYFLSHFYPFFQMYQFIYYYIVLSKISIFFFQTKTFLRKYFIIIILGGRKWATSNVKSCVYSSSYFLNKNDSSLFFVNFEQFSVKK